MNRSLFVVSSGLCASLIVGCGDSAPNSIEPELPRAPALNAPASPPPPPMVGSTSTGRRELSIPPLTLSVPTGWIDQPPKSSFIQAELKIPGDSGDIRLTISRAGGGLDSNLDRWKGQFQRGPDDAEPRRSSISVDGRSAEILELQGTFRDGFDPAQSSRPAWALFGVALPLGDDNIFLKATGPAAAIAAHRMDLMAMLESARLR